MRLGRKGPPKTNPSGDSGKVTVQMPRHKAVCPHPCSTCVHADTATPTPMHLVMSTPTPMPLPG